MELTIKERMALKRNVMPVQPPMERNKNWQEVNLGFNEEMARNEAKRCISCKKPLCIDGCPVKINIPKFIKEIELGKFSDAYSTLIEANRLPAICGRVCPQEKQCEAICVVGKKQDPVAIGYLERFAADYQRENKTSAKSKKGKSTGKKVAVVGAGPAGLTVAGELASLNHEVTIFEALHTSGGVLAYGIPDFRLPKEIVEHEIGLLKKAGVNIETNYIIGRLDTVDELLEEFDAVFLGTGAGLPYFMNIPGETLNGVCSANEFLTRVILMKARLFPEYKTPVFTGNNVVVVGCGDTAMDACRSAKRLGVENVTILYRRSKEEAPARIEERIHAEEEGIEFQFLASPVRLLDNGKGWVKWVEAIKMKLGEPDPSGRRRPIPIEGSEYMIEADSVIMAIGFGVNPTIVDTTNNLHTDKYGVVTIDEKSGMTSRNGVFAGGDIISGGSTVIMAMGQGKRASAAIDEFIMSK